LLLVPSFPLTSCALVRAIKDYAHHKKVQQFAGEKGNFSSPRNRQVIQESFVETRKTKNRKENSI